jgi:hypothetical protein
MKLAGVAVKPDGTERLVETIDGFPTSLKSSIDVTPRSMNRRATAALTIASTCPDLAALLVGCSGWFGRPITLVACTCRTVAPMMAVSAP